MLNADWPHSAPSIQHSALLLSPPTCRASRRAIVFFASNARNEAFAFIEPHLDADLAVGGTRFGKPVVDVGTQRLQRQLAVQVPRRARDLRPVQPSRHPNLDPARPE